jgi:hypothetical protein
LPIGIQFDKANNWVVSQCKILFYTSTGILVDNTNNPDSGDSLIEGCLINTSVANTVGIEHHASGGLKIIGNKFNGGAIGYRLSFNGAVNTGDLLMSGNSLENFTNQAILLGRLSGTSTYGHIAITGNQIALTPIGIQVDTSGAIYDVTITGNSINIGGTNGQAVAIGTCDNFVVSGNSMRGNGGTTQGLNYGVGCTNGLFIGNQLVGFGMVNSSAAGSVRLVNNPI